MDAAKELVEDVVNPILAFHRYKRLFFSIDFTNPLIPMLRNMPEQVYVDVTSQFRRLNHNIFIESVDPEFSFGTSQKLNLLSMLSKSVPSSFGHGHENIFDPSVRKGRELRFGEHFIAEKDVVRSFLVRENVENEVQSRLFPSASTLTFKFNKIAIYEEGGELVLRPPGSKEETEWKTNDQEPTWIAFYTSIPHEIKVVTGGTRVVAQFDVYCYSPGEDKDAFDDADLPNAVQFTFDTDKVYAYEENKDLGPDEFDDFGNLTFSTDALSRPGRNELLGKVTAELQCQMTAGFASDPLFALALPLYHMYPHSAIRPTLLNAVDRSLFDSLLNAGYLLQLVPVIIVVRSSGVGDGCGVYKLQDGKKSKYDGGIWVRQANDVIQAYLKEEDNGGLPNSMKCIKISITEAAKSNVTYIETLYEDKEVLKSKEASDYTGNEGSPPDMHYFSCAIIVRPAEMRANLEVNDATTAK